MLQELLFRLRRGLEGPEARLRRTYGAFRRLLQEDTRCLELIAELEEVLYGQVLADPAYVEARLSALCWHAGRLVDCLADMGQDATVLRARQEELAARVRRLALGPMADDTPGGPPLLPLQRAHAYPQGLLGGKAWALARLAHGLRLPVPPAAVATTAFFRAVMAHGGQGLRLAELLSQVRLDDPGRLEDLCAQLRAMALDCTLPDDLERDLLAAAAGLGPSLAVRSSAVGEDAAGAGFAGQYDSVLHVRPQDAAQAWRQVLASRYSPRAVAYRVRKGLSDAETPMAVLLMAMVEPASSGVMYTREPKGRLGIYAVPGLGAGLVDGSRLPDVYVLTRQSRPALLRAVSQARVQEGVAGSTAEVLAEAEAVQLARHGLALEDYFGAPQDVEWAQDRQGRLFILQSRPLEQAPRSQQPSAQAASTVAPLLFRGGQCASAGVAAGPVHVLAPGQPLQEVPAGAVLVAPHLSPELSSLVGRVAAVVSPSGSRASHFASVAREFGLPVVAGCKAVLQPGRTVTVHADAAAIHDGLATELLEARKAAPAAATTPQSLRLAALAPLVSRLHLTDPEAPEFAPRGVQSLHDLVRYCHEKGVAAMFGLGQGGVGGGRPLATALPLEVRVLDLGGGLPEAGAGPVDPAAVQCLPMRALWAGLTDPDVDWNTGGVQHADWGHLADVAEGGIVLSTASLASYVLLAEDYLHAMVRFGFHFAVVDALAGERDEANYAGFRFKGGGAAQEKRLYRLGFVAEILRRAGFRTRTRGDLLDARCDRLPRDATLARLRLLGVLLGRTRVLDLQLAGVEQAMALAETFWSRHGALLETGSGQPGAMGAS